MCHADRLRDQVSLFPLWVERLCPYFFFVYFTLPSILICKNMHSKAEIHIL